MKRKFGALSSSVNPQELAATVTGFMKAIAGVVVTLGLIAVPDGQALVDNVGVIVAAAYSVWGAGETIFGIIRKIVVRFVGE